MPKQDEREPRNILVTKGFWHDGERLIPGDVIHVRSDSERRTLVGNNHGTLTNAKEGRVDRDRPQNKEQDSAGKLPGT